MLGRRVEPTDVERRPGDPEAIASFNDLETSPRKLLPGRARRLAAEPDGRVIAENLVRAQRAGVTVAAGSDAGNIGTLHGPALHRELALMAEAGLTPMQVLVAATRGGTAVMRHSRDLGTLEAGKLADMVILNADPLADVRHTRRIHRVIKGGEVFDPNEIARTRLAPC